MHADDMTDPLTEFATLFEQSDRSIDLLDGAFAVARIVHPTLDPAPYRDQIDRWAVRLLGLVEGRPYPMQRVRALRQVLFEDVGLAGNRHDYYDPRNSCLNDVIDRRVGIPISLAVLTIAVAGAAGIALEGVGFPGHFLVRYVGDDESFILLDPFFGSEILIEADCRERLRATYGPHVDLEPRYMQPVSERQMVTRMLLNLKNIYLRRRDYPLALAVVDRLLLVDPIRHAERRDRGMLLLGLQRFQEAIDSFEGYLTAVPAATDAEGVRRLIDDVRAYPASD